MVESGEVIDAVTLQDVQPLDTRDPVGAAHANQLTYTGEYLSQTVSDDVRFLLRNPSGSGRACHLYALSGYQSASGVVFMEILKNPTSGLPTTQQNIMVQSQGLGEQPSQMEFLADQGAATTGGETDTNVRLPDTGRILPLRHSLGPGESVGGTTSVDAGLSDATVHAALFWFEEPI